MYDGTRTPASPGRPYALESSGSVRARGNGGPSAPRSREIRKRMHDTDSVHTDKFSTCVLKCDQYTIFSAQIVRVYDTCHRAAAKLATEAYISQGRGLCHRMWRTNIHHSGMVRRYFVL